MYQHDELYKLYERYQLCNHKMLRLFARLNARG